MDASVNGITISYDDSGSGPPLVLIHAFPLGRAMWAVTRAALSEDYRVIAPDLRGFGASQTAKTATMAEMADDVIALLDALEIGSAVIAGLSMGGYVALELTQRHPHRVSGLILADTRAGADTSEGRANRSALAQAVRSQGAGVAADQMLPKLTGATTQAERPELSDELRALIEANSPEGIAAAALGMGQRRDFQPYLGAILVPTLVIVGAEDVITPPTEAEALAAMIPKGTLEIIPGAGHLANLEQPEAFNRSVRRFLDRVYRR